jgi:hypothetical protein
MRRRFIQNREPPYDFVEVGDHVPRRRDDLLQGDRNYDGLKATDGTDISSRTKHREYMKRNGLTMMDDFKETWSDQAKQRADFYTAGKGGAVTKKDIEKAIATLESSRR